MNLAEKIRWMIGNGASDDEVDEAIRKSQLVREREKTAVVDVLSAMATFAQREGVTFNADAIVAEAMHMAREMMK